MSDEIRLLPYRSGFGEFWRDNGKSITPYLIAVVILIAGSIANPGFSSMTALLIRIKVASFFGIIAIAQTTVILSGGGGIDQTALPRLP
jgi:ribose transport system permease protein